MPLLVLDRPPLTVEYALAAMLFPPPLTVARWALAVLDQALIRLRQETAASGKGRQFERLSAFLSREAETGEYAAIGSELGISGGAVGVAVHRLRQRYRECVRDEIASTLSDPSLVDEEMRHLLAALQNETQ